MIINKNVKFIVSSILVFIMFFLLGQSLVFAKVMPNRIFDYSNNRYVKNGEVFEPKGIYGLNNWNNHIVFQILERDVNDTTKIIGNNYFCVNATEGASWRNVIPETSKVTYDRMYDLVEDKSEISNLEIPIYKDVVKDNYTQLMWVLDHILSSDYTDKDVDDFLAQAGIKYGDTGNHTTDGESIISYYFDPTNIKKVNSNSAFAAEDTELYRYLYGRNSGYYYIDENGNKKDLKLSKELIEITEQAVIWYFTNNDHLSSCYTTDGNCVTPAAWISYPSDSTHPTLEHKLLANDQVKGKEISDSGTEQITTSNTGLMLQEQASILFNYLVDAANKAASEGYESSSEGTISLDYANNNSNSKVVKEGTNYKIGPLKATTTGNTTIESVTVTSGTNSAEISEATLQDANGNAITKLTSGQSFYVIVPQSKLDSNVKIKVKAKTKNVKKNLLVKEVSNNNLAEQPIVEVIPEEKNIETEKDISLGKQFDLALRKIITKVDGVTTVKDEKGNDASRFKTDGTLNIDSSTIPVTATYKHRKDPVVVKNGSRITFEIKIFNEGDIDGYATKIVDQLPKGLKSVLTTGNTVTSSKGNVYEVNYDETSNKITFTMTNKVKEISAYGSSLDSDTIVVEATVNQSASTDKHYLTNIAYIAEEEDKSGNKITADRDGNESKPTESPSKTADELNSTNVNSYKGNTQNDDVDKSGTNNDYFFRGEQDDDDFEKVVVLPKQFDLALRKFITKVNTTEVTDRIPSISESEIQKLVIGDATYDKGTTLEKIHKKDKVRIKKGDTVVYTIRIYNEGEVDGYATEITDYLPEGLTLKADSTINTENGWVPDGQKITTTKLKDTLINAFNKNNDKKLDYKELLVECIVNDKATSSNLKNIAEITEQKDIDGNSKDTDSTPKNVDTDDYNPTNPDKGRGEEDDDDFEDLQLAELDLALRKFIAKISSDGKFPENQTTIYPREPEVDTSKLKDGTEKTAKYNHSKEPMQLYVGDYVLYTIRVYNEGDIDGYASQIIDYLPENLDFVDSTDSFIKAINDKWTYDSETRKVTTKPDSANATTKLKAFDSVNDDGKGSGLSSVDVQIVCKVNNNTPANKKLTNIAEISEYKDENGNVVNKDRDSEPKNIDYPENPETYKDDEINKDYVPGQQDDDDFEKVIVKERKVDLALTKFITAVSADTKIEDGEYLTPNKKIGSKTNEYIRATVADTTGLKAGTSTNATYSPKKDIEPLSVNKNSYILYNIRVYNEGEVDVFAGEITDYLPENLEFVNGEFNKQYGWTANGQTVKTSYLSSKNGSDKILKAFDKVNDDGKGSGLDYKDLPILCKVSDKAQSGKKMVNTAEITKYEDKDGKEIPKDIDSTPENKKEKNVEKREEDDDDYEVVVIKDFDLALRKFITDIGGKEVTSRIPKVSYKNNKITYTHPKDVVKLAVNDIVTYTLRVFNEGQISGFAQTVTDDIPDYLEFLPENKTNRDYRWVMYDKDGKTTTNVKNAVKIVTDYTSKAYGETLMKKNNLKENPNLLKAFDKTAKISDTNPDYVDVKVAFKVKDPKSNKTVITNKAQISEDADENGNPIDDIDSTPDKWKDGEDDQDYENVSVEYFDLSLLKYVTKAIVTENGRTKTTKTGNNGSSKDITPKVEIYRKSINKTIVKFEYVIKVTNEGDIEGYATEITDYVPKGLKFYEEDNKGWKDEGNNVISTTLLKDTLLKPGQSATVKVVLRWVNGENNLSLKTNIAEISKDKNEKGIPDRDSTPDNQKPGEDDIDDAPVLLTISTGMLENTITYVAGALAILVVIGLGVAVIKKYVI